MLLGAIFECPSPSLDLNLVETLGDNLGNGNHAQKPSDVHVLKQVCKEKRDTIPQR